MSGEEIALGDHVYTEQGIQVLKLNDYEWWAGGTEQEIILAACKAWGFESAQDGPALAEADGCFERSDVQRCNLDTSLLNAADEGEKAAYMSFRESIRRRLAAGETFPTAFCGIDG